MAKVKQVQVTFDCANPRAVAEFWKAVLGYVDPPTPPGFDSWDAFDASLPAEDQGSAWACQDPDGVGPRLFFQRVPEGKVVKNRVHLDVRVGTGLKGDERVSALEAEAARLEALGARQGARRRTRPTTRTRRGREDRRIRARPSRTRRPLAGSRNRR